MTDEFNQKNRAEWSNRLHKIFPKVIPHKAEWTRLPDIAETLAKISGNGVVHMLFPSHGGFDLDRVGILENYIVLDCNGIEHGLKPKRLLFRSFGAHLEWAYFRLETYSWARLDSDADPDPHQETTFLLLAKSAPYNRIPETYDGRHSVMSDEEFRVLMRDFHDGVTATVCG
jgi:hypothetical protein